MTIVECLVKSEKATKSRAGPGYVRVVQIQYTAGYSAAAVLYASDTNADPLLLHYGQSHPDDSRAVVSQVEIADPVDDGDDPQAGHCLFTITFAPFDAMLVENPLNRPPEIDWGGGEDQTEIFHKDYAGTHVKNSAGDYYDPLPERDIPGADVTIARFEASNPAGVIAAFSKTTNSTPIWGQAADTVKMGKIRSTKVYENNVGYWKTTYPLCFTTKEKGWRLLLIDNGFRVKSGSALRRATDDMGQHSPTPILLDGSGAELSVGGTPVAFPSAGLKQYDSADFNALGLPNPFM